MPDYRITIEIKNVGEMDIHMLAEQIMDNYGFDFDANLGEFIIYVAKREGDNYFPFDLGDS